MSSVTEPSSSSRCVYCARPGRDAAQVVAERALQVLEGGRALDPDGAQVADVEGHGGLAAGPVLGHRAPRIGQRHLPTAEGDHLGAERHVGRVERRLLHAAHAGPPPASRRRRRRSPGQARRRREGQLQAVRLEQGQEVALVDHDDRHLGIELPHAAHLAVLAGDQALIGRGQLDEEPPLGQAEVGTETRTSACPGSSQRSGNSTGSYSQRSP